MVKRNLLSFFFLGILSFGFTNCFLNPIFQSIVFPEEKEDSLLPFGALALLSAPSVVNITGQFRDPNGVAQANLDLQVLSRSNPIDGLPTTTSTTAGGRFFLKVSTGETTIDLLDDGSPVYRVTFNVNAFQPISFTTNGQPPGATISNLGFYDEAFPPLFFDVVSTTPAGNTNTNVAPSSFDFIFSENVENITNSTAWITNNVQVNPSISLMSLVQVGNNVNVMVSGFSSSTTNYTIYLGPGIRSAGGLALSPYTFTFTCVSPCNP